MAFTMSKIELFLWALILLKALCWDEAGMLGVQSMFTD